MRAFFTRVRAFFTTILWKSSWGLPLYMKVAEHFREGVPHSRKFREGFNERFCFCRGRPTKILLSS
jgi:hypothetical protein